jgi:hypothetical protein
VLPDPLPHPLQVLAQPVVAEADARIRIGVALGRLQQRRERMQFMRKAREVLALGIPVGAGDAGDRPRQSSSRARRMRIVQAPWVDAAMVATPPGGGNGKTFFAREGFFGDPGSAGCNDPVSDAAGIDLCARQDHRPRTGEPLAHAEDDVPYGIVDLKREKNHVRPVARATEFRIIAA